MRALAAAALAALLAAACLAPRPAAAFEGTEPARARQELRQRLTALSQRQQQVTRALNQARADLADLDQRMAQARTSRADLATQQADAAERLPVLAAEVERLSRDLEGQEALFMRHLRALYLAGPDASLYLLATSASFQDALDRARSLTTLLQADRRRMERLRAQRAELDARRAELTLRRNELMELTRRLGERQRELVKLRRRRSELVSGLVESQQALSVSMKALSEAEARLARTFALDQGAGAPAGRPATPVTAARGRLSPPVEGRVIRRGGPGGRGVVMAARPEAQVRAPWDGEVVYADKLAGYGNVVVLDHGQRVHTVLAYLGTLSVETGRRVKAGAVLGAVGPAGRLYLEVRLGARPVNPMAWLALPTRGSRTP